jgi:hypothetical protein
MVIYGGNAMRQRTTGTRQNALDLLAKPKLGRLLIGDVFLREFVYTALRHLALGFSFRIPNRHRRTQQVHTDVFGRQPQSLARENWHRVVTTSCAVFVRGG